MQNNSETLATFSLPAGLAYPVQIPAGVTLQTASGMKWLDLLWANICCSCHPGLTSRNNTVLYSFVSLRSTLQGQCSCRGYSGPGGSEAFIPTHTESSCPSVDRSPSDYQTSSAGGATPCSSTFCLPVAAARFPPQSREQSRPAATSSLCWRHTASGWPLSTGGRKWAESPTWTCGLQYDLNLQSVIRGGLGTDDSAKEQRHRWHPEGSDWGGERESRTEEESATCQNSRSDRGCSRRGKMMRIFPFLK